jgi:hypothetical protein
LVDEPQRSLIIAAVLNNDEHDRNNGNHRAKHVEQDLRCPDSHKLAAEFFRQDQ